MKSGGLAKRLGLGIGLFILGRGIDSATVHLDPRDTQQSTLEDDSSLTGLVAFFIDKNLGVDVADFKPDQHLLLGVDLRLDEL